MPCHIVKTEPLFSYLQPVKPNFSFHESLGHGEEENPGAFGVWAMEAGESVTYKNFAFHAFIAITEGELWIEDLDKQTGPVTMHAGDILHVPVGTSARWGTPTKCKGIYVHLRPKGDHAFLKDIE